MDRQSNTSANIIDKRKVASHGLLFAIGIILGRIFGVSPPVDRSQDVTAVDKDGDLVQVVSTALDRGQAFWSARIPDWRDAHVVLFSSSLETPCGLANKMTGPFYCPADEHIYIDLQFLRSIDGDLGQAYVIAHELGHHVQYLTGQLAINAKSAELKAYFIELQADCYAGVWMQNEMANNHLETGDVEEAYMEAVQVGDTGAMDTWTHGDSEHRVAAVKRGLKTGECDL